MTVFRMVRDAVTFLAGLVLAGHEVLTTPDGAEPSLIVLGLAATMMGLPGTLGVDRLLNRDGPTEPTPTDASSSPPQAPSPRRHAR